MTPNWVCRYSSDVSVFILKPTDQSAGVGAAMVAAIIIHVEASAAYKPHRRRNAVFSEPVMKITSNNKAMMGAVAITGVVAMPMAQLTMAPTTQLRRAHAAARIHAQSDARYINPH